MEPSRDGGAHARRINTEFHDNSFEPDDDTWDDEIVQTPTKGGTSSFDRRKFIDTTTPTLEDEDAHNDDDDEDDDLDEEEEDEEDDVEEEMISLEQERRRRGHISNINNTTPQQQQQQHQSNNNIINNNNNDSLRRTPGAMQMHQSSRSSTELLGFGLALTTPIAGKQNRRSPASRPPRDPNKREDVSYTPASLSLTKNPHIQVSHHGAFSPNTLRLTEDLDNLLDEEEDDDDELLRKNQFFRNRAESDHNAGGAGAGGGEQTSWTQQYIFESEGGTAEVTRMGKKNRRVSAAGRRSRNSNNESPRDNHPAPPRQEQQQTVQQLLFEQQQQQQPTSRHNNNVRGGQQPQNQHDNDEVPQPLNFGGAFAPPHSNRGIFQRPVPTPNEPRRPSSDPPAFSSYSKPFVPQQQQHPQQQQQQQAFNQPRAFAPHDPRMGYPAPPPPMFNQHHQPAPFQQNSMMPGYDRAPRMNNSSFVPPNYMQGPHHGWPPPVMMPNNPYVNQHMPPQQQQPWGQETPWVDNSGFGYGLPPVVRMTPSPHAYPQPAFWQDPTVGYRNNSPTVAPPFAQQQQPPGSEHFRFDETTSFEEVDQSSRGNNNRNKGDSRVKRNDKKQQQQPKPGKVDKRKKVLSPPSPSSTTIKGGAAATTKRGGKGRKPEDEPENPEEAKRAELVESAETRAAFKEFYRNFRLNERSSIQEAEEYALKTLKSGSVPDKTHWRVYLELADLAKRSNKFEEARKLYSQVCELQPYASQGWLEFSKLEEECGHMNRCSKILNEGLKYCEISENLLTRAIKHEEKMNNLTRARELLARLKHVGIEKVWRTVLEGALLEGRAGNHAMARRVLKYLMHHVPWYGPLYLEAYRLERDLGRPDEALSIVEKGLKAIPRYGPLWFGAFRLCEILDFNDNAFHLPRTMRMFERAINSISRELVWKVHLEASQILERAALASIAGSPNKNLDNALFSCRKRVAMTVLSCPSNLSWKVWLAGGRMELSAGNLDAARSLFLRAHKVVPEKGRVATLLECARLEEFAGDMELARSILCKSRNELSTDWKVWLESVLLEIRDGEHSRALDLAKKALEKHSGTGRLWASLVQLRYIEGGEEAQYASLKKALRSVPKSGEVWCEGGRIHLNPFSKLFSLSEARRHLFFATRFTPQYGDGFLETLRLEMIERWILPMASCVWEAIQPLFVDQIEDTDNWISSLVIAGVKLLRMAASGESCAEFEGDSFDKSVLPSLRAQLETTSLDELFKTSNLELRCANADPNYGAMWFNCRHAPTDTARVVLRRTREQIVADVKDHAYIYVAAIIRRCGLMAATTTTKSKIHPKEFASMTLSVETILKSKTEIQNDTVLLESSALGFHFASGLVVLNRHKPLLEMTVLERKKALFGSDALF